MATTAPRELRIGIIVDKTLAVVERCAMPALVYYAALTVISGAIGYFALGMTAPLQQVSLGLLKAAVGIVCAYFFLDAMIRRTQLRSRDDGDVFLPYLGLSIVYTLSVAVGFILIILPGLYIMARWSMAQAMLIARGNGPVEALGESWDKTEDSAFQILVALLIFVIPTIAIQILCTLMLGRTSVAGMAIQQVASSASSVLTLAMGVALFGLTTAARSQQAPSSE